MDIKIQVLSIAQEAKQSAKGSTYQQLEIAYKDLTNAGKVASKKIMDFSSKDVFQVLAHSKPVEVFDISMEKKGDYWNWVKATKGQITSDTANVKTAGSGSSSTGSTGSVKGGWETPEERKAKQKFIVRQSSLTNAIATLTVGRKSELKPDEVIELAKYYESFVFAEEQLKEIVQRDIGRIEDMDEDPIPF